MRKWKDDKAIGRGSGSRMKNWQEDEDRKMGK
jgi:hypothetical protein